MKFVDVSLCMASGAAFLSASLLRSCSKSLHLVVRISTVSLRSFFSVARRVILSLQASRSTLRFSFSKSSGFIASVALFLVWALEEGFGGGFIVTVGGAVEVNGGNMFGELTGAGKLDDTDVRGVIGHVGGIGVADCGGGSGDPQENIWGDAADDKGGGIEVAQVNVGGGTNNGDTETCWEEDGGIYGTARTLRGGELSLKRWEG